ncbi:unnamed protein product, partial [Ectocarpus sp. 8 AP-2014]
FETHVLWPPRGESKLWHHHGNRQPLGSRRFHFRQHTEEQCALHNSPEARDDPTLWHV